MTVCLGIGVVDIPTKYYEYISALKDVIIPCAKLEFLSPDGKTPILEITSDFIADGSTLTVNYQNGTRRSATINISNWDQVYGVNVNSIWFGQQIRLYAGLLLHDGEEYLLPQGVFYISNPTEVFEPTRRVVTLQLVDKWAALDGSLFGTLDGIYQINSGDNLFTAVEQLLLKDRGNGLPIDGTPPRFSSYFKDKTVTLSDGSFVPITNAPYTSRIDAGSTYADILLEIATMLVASIGYDCNGMLCIESVQTDIQDYNKPSMWDFSIDEKELFAAQFTSNMTSMYNDVRVVGAVLNGTQIKGHAKNTNPISDCNIQRVGAKTFLSNQAKYYSYDQCDQLAKYELKKRTMLQKSVGFSSSPIYHLQENTIVTLLRPDVSSVRNRYLITGFSLPLGGIQPMSISAVSVNEFDIYHNWLTHHTLTVFCSQIEALTLTYSNESGETVVTGLTNPYLIEEIPAGYEVSFNVSTDPSAIGYGYTITSATLNGVALSHNGITCKFNMPSYDSQLVFQLSATDGKDFSYTYTGTCEDTTQVMNGITYRLLKMTTSGTFTVDENQLSEGVTCDVWLRGGGGGGNSSKAGKNGYDAYLYDTKIENSEIVVGDGGATGETSGRRGVDSSFGGLLTATAGGPATKSSTGTGGKMEKIFGFIEDADSGKGGDIGAAGSNGVCYIRIAKKIVEQSTE